MKTVAAPVDPAALAGELTPRVALARFRGIELHTFRGEECPATMREVGRVREIGFRAAGAGRNVELDVDALDFGARAYHQLVAWDPVSREIVAVYRYQFGRMAVEAGDQVLRTATLFRYTHWFDSEVKAAGIELGRSVVNAGARRRVLGLFALWVGLRALVDQHPEVRYYFGNVSIFTSLPRPARDLIVAFLEHWYPPPRPGLVARDGMAYRPGTPALERVAALESPVTTAAGIAALRALLRPWGVAIPPLLQSYLGISRQVWFGQTALDRDFGDALETGIVVPVSSAERSGAIGRFGSRDESEVNSPAGAG